MLNWFLACVLALFSGLNPGLPPLGFFAPGVSSQGPRGDAFEIRFVDDLGKPIGARPMSVGQVWRSPNSSSWRGLADVPKELGADGVLRLAPRRGWTGGLSVSFQDQGLFGHAKHDSLDFEWDGEPGRRVVTIPRLATAEGRVITGAPIDDVSVSIPGATFGWYRPAIEGLHVAFSGPSPTSRGLDVEPDGSFRLEKLTPGPIEITLSRGQVHETHSVDLAPGQTLTGLEFDLSGGGWIVGHARDIESRALCDAYVTSSPAAALWDLFHDGSRSYCDVAADGAFRLGSLDEGLHRVELWSRIPRDGSDLPPPFDKVPVLMASSLAWADGTSERELDLVASGPSIEVRGHVRGLDPAITTARVTLRSPRMGRGASAAVGWNGHFALSAPGPGEFEVTVAAMEGDPRIGPFAVPLTLASDADAVSISIELPTSGLELLIPAAETEVQRARVLLHRSGSQARLQTFEPDDRVPGEETLLRCDGLAPGLYHVRALTTGSPTEILFERSVEVGGGQRALVRLGRMEHGSVVLPKRLMGRIEESSASAFVAVRGAPFTSHLSHAPPGRHALIVRQGSLAALVQVDVEANRATRVEPELEPGGILIVQILFEGHATNADVTLRHGLGFRLDPDSPEHYVFASSGEPYGFHGLPPGTYKVLVEGEVRDTLTIGAGESLQLEIERVR